MKKTVWNALRLSDMSEPITCQLCPHYCKLNEGQIGFACKTAKSGEVQPLNYGKITSLALDPIEKKPLAYYHPGSKDFVGGSFGCNMVCPFCQNYHISDRKESRRVHDITRAIDSTCKIGKSEAI